MATEGSCGEKKADELAKEGSPDLVEADRPAKSTKLGVVGDGDLFIFDESDESLR